MHRATAAALLLTALAAPSSGHAQDCRLPGDVAPMPHGDGVVTVADALVMARFVVGLDLPSESEQRFGDVAPTVERVEPVCSPCPREAWGDGVLTVGDVAAVLSAAVGNELAWPLRSSGGTHYGAPPHTAIQWVAEDYPGECSELVAVTHTPEANPRTQALCRTPMVEPWAHETSRVTCWLDAIDEGPGAAYLWWRSPDVALRPVPVTISLLGLDGRWVSHLMP